MSTQIEPTDAQVGAARIAHLAGTGHIGADAHLREIARAVLAHPDAQRPDPIGERVMKGLREIWGDDLTPEWLREKALDYERSGEEAAAQIIRLVADFLPEPPVVWPTEPGSTARCDRWLGHDGEVRIAALDEEHKWYILGYKDPETVDSLRTQGFTPVHDAGVEA